MLASTYYALTRDESCDDLREDVRKIKKMKSSKRIDCYVRREGLVGKQEITHNWIIQSASLKN